MDQWQSQTLDRIEVIQFGERYIAKSTYAQKDIVKAAGFRWDGKTKCWYTTDQEVAAKLSNISGLNEEISAKAEAEKEAIEESRAADSTMDLPVPEGLSYLPYQRAGIAYALKHNNVMFADEMGLGKTIRAIGVINSDPTVQKVLIVCPASLKLNWRNELRKWLVRDMSIGIAQGDSCHVGFCDILIVNYDVLDRHAAKLRAVAWDLVVADEAHYMKSPDAKRTIALVGSARKGKEQPAIEGRRRLLLTGTPIPNRPIEGFTLFNYLDPEKFSSRFGFAKRYCNAKQTRYGWDMTGASNLDELQRKLRASFMIRRLKQDVLTELPAKRRTVVEIAQNGGAAAVEAENRAWEQHESQLEALRAEVELAKASDNEQEYKDAVARLREASMVAFTEMSKRRHETALAMLPYAIEHITNVIEDGSKVVVFAHHVDVIEALAKEFGAKAVKLYGASKMEDRQTSVERFQSDPSCLVFIGQIQAAGVGITLTASSHVIFVELDWVPANVSQAEDRTHRVGQKNMVVVEHLVLEGSLGARMAKVIVAKQEVIDRALDRQEPEQIEQIELPVKETAATQETRREQIIKQAESIKPEQIAAVHQGLRILAGFDTDHARDLNGIGFSRLDVRIGHSLANAPFLTARQAALGAKFVNKYRRQLPAELVAAAKG